MKPPQIRLAATVVLFAAWMGYLAYLVRERPLGPSGSPVVLSRPQLLTSDLDVIARVESVDGPVKVEEIIYASGGNPPKGIAPDATIRVNNLAECHSISRVLKAGKEEYVKGPPDFTGPGLYILPLQRVLGGKEGEELAYRVVPTPASPGFSPGLPSNFSPGLPRIYPVTPDSRAQLGEIVARKRRDQGGL